MSHKTDPFFQVMADKLSDAVGVDADALYGAIAVAQMGELNCIKAGLITGVCSPVYWAGIAYGMGMIASANGGDFVGPTDAVLQAMEGVTEVMGIVD